MSNLIDEAQEEISNVLTIVSAAVEDQSFQLLSPEDNAQVEVEESSGGVQITIYLDTEAQVGNAVEDLTDLGFDTRTHGGLTLDVIL